MFQGDKSKILSMFLEQGQGNTASTFPFSIVELFKLNAFWYPAE